MKKIKKKIVSLIIIILITPYIQCYANSTNNLYDGGNGTKENPYLISNSEQFKNIQYNLNAYYKLTQDIDFTYDTTNSNGVFYNDGLGWIPIEGRFEGDINGNGKKIIGLNQIRIINDKNQDNQKRTGLFEELYNANVYNLEIKEVNIYYEISSSNINNVSTGAFGFEITKSNFESVIISGSINIVTNNIPIYKIYNNVGGFTPHISDSNFSNCVNNINIKSDFPGLYGGFASQVRMIGSKSCFDNCVNNGNIEAIDKTIMKDFYVAGIVSWIKDSAIFTNCTNNGNLYGKSVGGIASYSNSSEIKYCKNYGELNVYSMNSGGIVGSAYYKGTNSIDESFNAGTINIYSSQAYDDGCIGGIVGKITGNVRNVYNIGKINIYSSNVNAQIGGIVGYLKGNLLNCYNIGKMNLDEFDINAIYYTSNSSSPTNTGTFIIGCICGGEENSSNFSNCYYLDEVVPIIIYGRSKTHVLGYFEDKPLNINQMLNEESFIEFDFENTWNMNRKNNYDYPQLNKSLINGIEATNISFDTQNMECNIGDIINLEVHINPINSTNRKCEWRSTNSSVAKVENGKITVLNYGKTNIIVTLSNGLKAECELNVSYLKGDLNGDGKINGKDWNMMYEHINETKLLTEEEFERADINEDGKVNGKDWNRLYEHINETNPLF